MTNPATTTLTILQDARRELMRHHEASPIGSLEKAEALTGWLAVDSAIVSLLGLAADEVTIASVQRRAVECRAEVVG